MCQRDCLQIDLACKVFVCHLCLPEQLFQIDPYFTELVDCRCTSLGSLIVFVFPFVVEDDPFDGLLLSRRRPMHPRVSILVRDSAAIDHDAVKVSRFLVHSCVQGGQDLVPTVTISCSLYECLLLMVEESSHPDGLV